MSQIAFGSCLLALQLSGLLACISGGNFSLVMHVLDTDCSSQFCLGCLGLCRKLPWSSLYDALLSATYISLEGTLVCGMYDLGCLCDNLLLKGHSLIMAFLPLSLVNFLKIF